MDSQEEEANSTTSTAPPAEHSSAPPSKPSSSQEDGSPRTTHSSPGLGSRPASTSNGKVSAAGSEAGLPPIHRQSSNLANRIAAFSSGVAPVRKGITNADEDAITVEEVLHKLETAGRVTGQEKYDLPVPLIRSAHQHLVAAREEAARTAKELAELKASRVQHIPPSTWIKREQKYKMDQEKYEHTIGQLRQRTEGLERELVVLREGSNVRPLEEKIQELEHQLVAAAAEKTKVQSKFHELSIKHRQLIETSPQVATIWNEVLVQQAADGHNAAAMQRLCNFDLRHTAASSGVSTAQEAGASSGVVSQQQLPGVSAAAAIYSSTSGPVPVPQAPHYSSSSSSRGPAAESPASTEQSGPSTPMQQPPGSGSPGHSAAVASQQQPQQPQTAEDRAHALMAAVALEGLTPEASIAALQQLNYDLTMQLGCYQQMVSRLKDAMEQSDLEKAELEAEKMALEMQLAGGASERGSMRGWGSSLGFWRRSVGFSTGGPSPMEDLDEAGSIADGASLAGAGSLGSSRRSSMDLDAAALSAAAAAVVNGGGGGSNSATPTKAAVEAASAAAAEGSSEEGGPQPQQKPAANTSSGGGLFAARRQRAAARAAAAADNLNKEVKELKRQVKTLQDENKYLVNNLVEIKMELAETQSSHDQAKRALVRAMDKESCLDLQVVELKHMLDMATNLNEQYEQAASTSMAAAAAGVMAAAAKAAVAAVSSTPNSAKAAAAALQSPFGRAEPDAAEPGVVATADSTEGSIQGAGPAADADASATAAAAAGHAAATPAEAFTAGHAAPAADAVAAGHAAGAEEDGAHQVSSFQLSEASSTEDAEDVSGGDAAAGSSSEGPAAAADAPQEAAVPEAAATAAAPPSGDAHPGPVDDKQHSQGVDSSSTAEQ